MRKIFMDSTIIPLLEEGLLGFAENLQKKLEEVNAVKNLTNRVPAVVEVQKMIDQAKELPAVMEY